MKALFPVKNFRMTQGRHTPSGWSHNGLNAYDLGGPNSGDRAAVYAPYDCVVKLRNTSSGGGLNALGIESTEKVEAANGRVDYQWMFFLHDNNAPHSVGTSFKRGAHIYTMGTAGTKSSHVHIQCGFGQFPNVAWPDDSRCEHANLEDAIFVPDSLSLRYDPGITGYGWKRTGETLDSRPPTGPSEEDLRKAREAKDRAQAAYDAAVKEKEIAVANRKAMEEYRDDAVAAKNEAERLRREDVAAAKTKTNTVISQIQSIALFPDTMQKIQAYCLEIFGI